VTSAPLPLAPRPHSGEAVSSWISRIGARYDIVADALVEHVLDRPSCAVGAASKLNYQAAPELEAALAKAARIAPAAISMLRIAGDDGSNSCWHRPGFAWCPNCIRADLAEYGELYERAIWRLGFCVVCPEHNVPLEDTCCRCSFEDRCHFYCADGLLGLACNTCGRPEGRAPRRTHEWWEDASTGAFGTCITPSLNRLIGMLQRDLQAAIAGARPNRSWGFLRSAKGLVMAVRHVTFCLILATRMRFEPRIILPEVRPGETFVPAPEPITLAALSTRAAYGVLAISAAVLRSLEGRAERHHWKPEGGKAALNTEAFLAWLPADTRRQLKSWSTGWERPARDALQAAIAAVEAVR
jgi:hypothetical protein